MAVTGVVSNVAQSLFHVPLHTLHVALASQKLREELFCGVRGGGGGGGSRFSFPTPLPLAPVAPATVQRVSTICIFQQQVRIRQCCNI